MKSTIAFASAFLASLVAAAPAPTPTPTPTPAPAPAPAQAAGQTVSVSWDAAYDVGTSSLATVTCSDGPYGLLPRGFTDFASLPIFPNIGGAPTIADGNSPNCGKCYELHYSFGNTDKTINVIGIDSAPSGFNIGLQAMNALTNGQAERLGRIDATYVQVDDSVCGM
ncbi:Cerato-platanin [Penicillium paradoxum]|uniref:Cerato-platanin n=1 Tax=Penicillium paradoxum TaxID=176176 RepID=UPI00254881D1|nr:Cerato-platanin [Penicillium paradoxum]KAJ5780123.1 Cerato-platanin [Penicillium paradoxum]